MSTTRRRCLACGAALPSTARSNRLYCDGACRTRAHRQRHGLHVVTELDELIAGLPPEVAEVGLVTAVAFAGRTSWQASAWILERRWPERWGLNRLGDPDKLEPL